MYVKLVSIPTDKEASPDIFFARAGFEQGKAKVAINVIVFRRFQVRISVEIPAVILEVHPEVAQSQQTNATIMPSDSQGSLFF